MSRRARGVVCGLSLALLLGGPASPGRADEFKTPKPESATLKNGLRLLVLRRPGVPLVQMQVQFPAGSMADPVGKEGLASLTARLLSRGTEKRDAAAFAEQVEFLGGSLDAGVAHERSLVSGEFAARDFETGLGLMAEMVRQPAFAGEEFEKERGLALAGLEQALDDPESLADLAFTRWMYGAHPYGRPPGGTKTSLASLTRADVVAFHRARYLPGGATLILSGTLDPRQARAAVERLFGSWRGQAAKEATVPAPAPVTGRKVLLVDKPDATQTQIRLGNVATRRADPALDALTVANTVLGAGFTSWLVDEVRVKRGLTYSISSRIGARRAGGSLSVSTFSKNETALETINLTLELMGKMRQGGLGAADLEKGRSYLAGLYPLSIESPDALAGAILDVEFYGLAKDSIDTYRDRIRAVSLDQARAAAARWVPVSDLAIAVVGPAADLEKPLAALGPVTVRPSAWVIDKDR
jgi:zinc protease